MIVADTILTAIARRLRALLAPPDVRHRPWIIDGQVCGFVNDHRAARLARFRDVFDVRDDRVTLRDGLDDRDARTDAVDGVSRALSAEGALTRWRDERYAVAAAFDEPPLLLLERAAARYFGIRTYAAHVNGVFVRDGSERMWIARRSSTKAIDPGLLDNMVGGGIAAGSTVRETVVKESFEEAGLPAAVAACAVPVGEVRVCREQPDGLQRETVFVHDLALPADFVPVNQDGEVCEWRALEVEALARTLASDTPPDVMTGDASLVAADWLVRRGYARADSPAAHALAALRAGRCRVAQAG